MVHGELPDHRGFTAARNRIMVVAICAERIGGSATRLAAELRRPQTLERGASHSSSDVGYNDQFQNVDPGQVNLIFLDLAH